MGKYLPNGFVFVSNVIFVKRICIVDNNKMNNDFNYKIKTPYKQLLNYCKKFPYIHNKREVIEKEVLKLTLFESINSSSTLTTVPK